MVGRDAVELVLVQGRDVADLSSVAVYLEPLVRSQKPVGERPVAESYDPTLCAGFGRTAAPMRNPVAR